MESINIRKAKPTDVASILKLIKELATFEKEPNAVVITENDLLKDGFGENPLFYCYIAKLRNEVVGIALYYYRYSTWNGKTIHLEDLIVNEKYRDLGVGKMLFSKMVEIASHEKVRRLEWVVLNWNINAKDFYKKAGATIYEDWQIVQMNESQIANYSVQNR